MHMQPYDVTHTKVVVGFPLLELEYDETSQCGNFRIAQGTPN